MHAQRPQPLLRRAKLTRTFYTAKSARYLTLLLLLLGTTATAHACYVQYREGRWPLFGAIGVAVPAVVGSVVLLGMLT